MRRSSRGLTLEKDWRQTVVDTARLLHWHVYWTWNSIHSPAGFPDLVLVKDDRLIFAELKNEKGKPTVDQTVWLSELEAIPGVQVYLWRPQDWDAVVEVLQAK